MSSATTPPRCYLVEWYRSGLNEGELERVVADLDRCSHAVAADGLRVRRVMILAVPTDDVIFGYFEADSTMAIELVCVSAGMVASRITVAVADRLIRPQA